MNNKMNINFGLTGTVSVGKSTILNALLCNYLGETKLKRTTYVPFKFTNSVEEHAMSCEEIKNKIIEINQNCGEDIETTEFKLNFIGNQENLHNCSIIDFPGLNDPHEENDKMENVLFDKLIKLDYLIYIIDSNSSLNNKYERNLLEKLFEKIKNCETLTNLIILFNKYDIEDEEIDEIINEAKVFINEKCEEYKISTPDYFTISGRKLMITNVITNTKDQTVIPENVRLKVYGEYYGKIKGKKMINYSYEELFEEFKEMEYTDSEKSFLRRIDEAINDNMFFSKKYDNTCRLIEENFEKNIDKPIDEYFISIAYYVKINKCLTNDNKRDLIIKIFDYYYSNNEIEFEKKNFVKNVFFFVKDIINENECFDDKNKWLFHYFKKTCDEFAYLNQKEYIIDLITFVNTFDNERFYLYLVDFIIKFIENEKFTIDIVGNKILDFLVENYSIIKEDDELNIMFDVFVFEKIFKKNVKKLAQISNLCKYGHKIYVNYVSHMYDDEILHEAIDNHLSEMKFDYFNSITNRSYKEVCETFEFQFVKRLNTLISYEKDIFENFDEYHIDYYPTDILTLYNYYKK